MSGAGRPRRTVAAALVLGAVLAAGACGEVTAQPVNDRSTTAAAPEPLPDVTVDGFDGGPPLQLGEVRGPAVINFWGAWCAPCRDEMPLLQDFHEAQPDVRMIGIDYLDPQTDAARDLVAEAGTTYDLYSDLGGDLAGQGPFPALRGLPYTAFVDERGRVVHGEYVEITSVRQLADLVEQHLGVGA